MNREKLIEIRRRLRETVENIGYGFAGFEIVKENSMSFLRLYIEKQGGVGLDDCEMVTKEINEYLDAEAESLPDRYFLEVSSPGLERPLFALEDYERFKGSEASFFLKNGRKLTAVISGTGDGENITVTNKNGSRTLLLSDIRRARLTYKEEKGEKKTFKKKPAK